MPRVGDERHGLDPAAHGYGPAVQHFLGNNRDNGGNKRYPFRRRGGARVEGLHGVSEKSPWPRAAKAKPIPRATHDFNTAVAVRMARVGRFGPVVNADENGEGRWWCQTGCGPRRPRELGCFRKRPRRHFNEARTTLTPRPTTYVTRRMVFPFPSDDNETWDAVSLLLTVGALRTSPIPTR